MDNEQKLQLRLKQYSGKREYPKEYPPKAAEIQRRYDEQGFNTKNRPPDGWECAGQMASKLLVVLGDPEHQDKRHQYEQALEQFNIETGTFPDHIDPKTGRVKE